MIGYPPRPPRCVEVESRCCECGHVFRARKWLPIDADVQYSEFLALVDATRRELTSVAWQAFSGEQHGCFKEVS